MQAPSTPSVKVVFDYQRESSATPLQAGPPSGGNSDSGCPFDRDVHIMTPRPSEKQKEAIQQLKLMFSTSPQTCKDISGNVVKITYDDNAGSAGGAAGPFLCESTLMRFLIARNFSVEKAYDMIIGAVKWRYSRNMDNCISDSAADGAFRASIVAEGLTGKIYLPGRDRFGRQVVIFDNSVQNTKDVAGQLVYLGWNLELATLVMASTHHLPDPSQAAAPQADKYVIFMHLEAFSIFNCPPWAAVRETIQVLCSAFPERLGHCVCYQGPSVFTTVFNAVKSLIDTRTRGKVIFLTGDVGDGSANDVLMRAVIGDNWKLLTGAGAPVLSPLCSPGFEPATYWPYITNILEKCYYLATHHKAAEAGGSSGDHIKGGDDGGGEEEEQEVEEVQRIEAEVDREYYEYRSDYRGRAAVLINAPYILATIATYAIVVLLAVLLADALHGEPGSG